MYKGYAFHCGCLVLDFFFFSGKFFDINDIYISNTSLHSVFCIVLCYFKSLIYDITVHQVNFISIMQLLML